MDNLNQQPPGSGAPVYTDLALEAHQSLTGRTGREIEGVSLEEVKTDTAEITRIEVLNEQGARSLGKPRGLYITIESRGLAGENRMVHDQLSGVLAGELSLLIDLEEMAADRGRQPLVFVVGLGNWNATPDALGPRVLNSLMVTRHLYSEAPPELREGMRSVCALAPGVLGLTGIQTAEIIQGVVRQVQPDVILAIDALAARGTSRLGKTIQLSNTGIAPGSGLGKHRVGITPETMKIPVIAIGVPTVIGARSIVNDAIDELLKSDLFSTTERERFRHIGEQERARTLARVLDPFMGDLFVSPRGIDELIKDVSRIIAGGINVAIHPDITPDNLSLYL